MMFDASFEGDTFDRIRNKHHCYLSFNEGKRTKLTLRPAKYNCHYLPNPSYSSLTINYKLRIASLSSIYIGSVIFIWSFYSGVS